jgi:hypothetical protein
MDKDYKVTLLQNRVGYAVKEANRVSQIWIFFRNMRME